MINKTHFVIISEICLPKALKPFICNHDTLNSFMPIGCETTEAPRGFVNWQHVPLQVCDVYMYDLIPVLLLPSAHAASNKHTQAFYEACCFFFF